MGCCAGKSNTKEAGKSSNAPVSVEPQKPAYNTAAYTANNGGAAVLPGAPGGSMSMMQSPGELPMFHKLKCLKRIQTNQPLDHL